MSNRKARLNSLPTMSHSTSKDISQNKCGDCNKIVIKEDAKSAHLGFTSNVTRKITIHTI